MNILANMSSLLQELEERQDIPRVLFLILIESILKLCC